MATVWVFPLTIGTCYLLTTAAGAQPSSGQELVDFVMQAHRASRELVRTTSCRVEFQMTITNPRSNSTIRQSCSGNYWSSVDAIRLKVSDQNSNNPLGDLPEDLDYCWKDSVRKLVHRKPSSDGKKLVGAGRDGYENRYLHRCDAWARGLLVLNVPGTINCLSFERLVEKSTRLKRAEWYTIDGNKLAMIELVIPQPNSPGDSWDVQFYFDPSVNYLVRKEVYRHGSYAREQEVVQFKECAPGLYFPERVSGRSKDSTSSTLLSEIRVNQPLPADIFNFRYPHGVYLSDGIKGVSYRTDPEGNPISAVTPHSRGPLPPRSEAEPATLGTETQEEPRSLTRWILPLALVILASAGVVAVIRRRRAGTSNA